MKGWGPKKFGISFERREGNQTFWRDIPGKIRGVPEKFRPLLISQLHTHTSVTLREKLGGRCGYFLLFIFG